MISRDDIAGRAAARELETLEFKRSTAQRREAARTPCARPNHRGGRVVFGLEVGGRIVGQQVSDRTVDEVAQELREIEPPVLPSIDRVEIGRGREVLVVSFAAGHSQPYAYGAQVWQQVGATNQQISRDEYNRVLLQRVHAETRWENHTGAGWSVADLDDEEIRRTLEEGIRVGPVEDPGKREPDAMPRGLGLVKQDALLRAAVGTRRGRTTGRTTAKRTTRSWRCSPPSRRRPSPKSPGVSGRERARLNGSSAHCGRPEGSGASVPPKATGR